MVDHRDAFDFKAVTYNGSQHLTFVIGSRPRSSSPSDDLQLGYIANSGYQVQDKVNVNRDSTILDIHEFHVVDEGKTALMTTTKVQLRNVSEVGVSGLEEKRVANKGFQEVDLATGNINFEWDALENGVSLTESYNVVELKDPKHKYWDFL
jgi:Arylsulfotransferase (ASST)